MKKTESKQIKRELKKLRRTLSQAQGEFEAMRTMLAENQKRLEGLKMGRIKDLAPGVAPEQAVALLKTAIAGQQQVVARGEFGLEPLRQMIRSLESPGMTWRKPSRSSKRPTAIPTAISPPT